MICFEALPEPRVHRSRREPVLAEHLRCEHLRTTSATRRCLPVLDGSHEALDAAFVRLRMPHQTARIPDEHIEIAALG